jgi:acetoin utilization deacetylase AcuC-like enzyme
LLEVEDFYWLGRQLKKLGLPIFCVLEGGYSYELPDLIMAFLKGIDEKN